MFSPLSPPQADAVLLVCTVLSFAIFPWRFLAFLMFPLCNPQANAVRFTCTKVFFSSILPHMNLTPWPMQARFRIQLPLQLLGLALSLALPSKLCSACFASMPDAYCLARQHALQFLVGFLVPCAIVYLVELRFRVQFLHRKAC
jgi:hypothetical protein